MNAQLCLGLLPKMEQLGPDLKLGFVNVDKVKLF
jgi:hypothetical protein